MKRSFSLLKRLPIASAMATLVGKNIFRWLANRLNEWQPTPTFGLVEHTICRAERGWPWQLAMQKGSGETGSGSRRA